MSTLDMEIKKAQRYNRPLSVVMMDLDRFKGFNDKYGHQSGDSILGQVGALLRAATRRTDIVGRYGGEEFLIILPETPVDNAGIFAEKLRKLVESFGNRLKGSYPKCRLSASLGVASVLSDDQVDSLVSRADKALYQAKEEGRNKVKVLR
jgi:diguanylate cyclase (GGDEF)-like protein